MKKSKNILISFCVSIHIVLAIRGILQEAFQLHLNRIITKNVNRTMFQQYFRHPSCLKAWIGNQSQSIRSATNSLLEIGFNDTRSIPSDFVYVITGTSTTMPPLYFQHFPHFADLYLHFYSLLLWQDHRILEKKISKPFVHYFMVNASYHYFWRDLAKRKGWNYEFITTVNNVFGKNLVISDVAPSNFQNKSFIYLQSLDTDVKFLHPADGVLLSHALMKQDPCQLYQQAEQLLKKSINILIVNRTTRGILNMEEVYAAIAPSFLHTCTSSEWNLSLHHFENYSFLQQVQLSFTADIFFTIHGAALTNLIFMKPCSIVIEVLPWLYLSTNQFFRRYAQSVDVLHYEWMEGPNTTIAFPRQGKYRKCFDLIQTYLQKQFVSPYYELYLAEALRVPESLNVICMNDSDCRYCARTVRGIIVNTTRLSTILIKALQDREKCIKTHPFYISKLNR